MTKTGKVAKRLGVQVNYPREHGSRTPDFKLENQIKDLMSKYGARLVGSGESLVGHNPYVAGVFSTAQARSDFMKAFSKVEELRYLEVITRELRPGEQ